VSGVSQALRVRRARDAAPPGRDAAGSAPRRRAVGLYAHLPRPRTASREHVVGRLGRTIVAAFDAGVMAVAAWVETGGRFVVSPAHLILWGSAVAAAL